MIWTYRAGKKDGLFLKNIFCTKKCIWVFEILYTGCPKIYHNSVLHLPKYTANLYLQMQHRFAVNFGTLSILILVICSGRLGLRQYIINIFPVYVSVLQPWSNIMSRLRSCAHFVLVFLFLRNCVNNVYFCGLQDVC